MNQYNTSRIKSRIVKSRIRIGTGVSLKISSNAVGESNDEIHFPINYC